MNVWEGETRNFGSCCQESNPGLQLLIQAQRHLHLPVLFIGKLLKVLNDLLLHSQIPHSIPMLFARWRSQDLIFLTPYTAAPGFKPTSDSRVAPDWDFWRTLHRLSYSAAAGFQKNKFKNEPDSRRTGGSTFGRPRSRRCCPSTARLHFLPDKKMRSFGGWETGRWTGPRNLNSISPINMSPVLTKIPQVSPIPYRVLFCLTLLKEVALIIQLNASSIGFTGSGWWCRWLQ